MNKPAPINLNRIAAMALYTLGAWASLGALMFAATWEAQETLLQSARVIVLITAGMTLVMCVIAATARLVASASASLPDPDPKP